MKKALKIRRIISLLVAIATLVSPSLQAYTQEYVNKIADNHLRTFPVIEKAPHKEESIKPKNFKAFLQMITKPRHLGLRDLNDRDKREIAFKYMQQAPFSQEDIIAASLVDKLNLIRGEARPNDHLMGRLTTDPAGKELLMTTAGAKRFVEIVAQPTTDLTTIRKRQTIIRELVNNDALRIQCNQLLAKIQKAEPFVFDMYTRNPDSEEEKMKMADSQIGLKGTNTLTVTTRTGEVIFAIGVPLMIAGSLFQLGKGIKEDDPTKIVGGAFFTLYTLLVQLGAVWNMKVTVDIRKNMQERLMGMATYLSSLKQLAQTLEKDSAIGQLIPELNKIVQQLEYDKNASKDFNRLNELLRKKTFIEGTPSALSSPGNIVNAYRRAIQEEVRKEYAPAMNLLGELDVYVALANKIKAHQGLNAQFCFAEFIEKSDKPVIKATNFWNPFVDHTMVVGNNVALNTGQERDIILTGPNTGGKSTIMKGLMFSVVLAQTFGIAPAKSLSITPFTKLLTYLNISDDTGAGVSLFKAEVNQAKAIMETVRALKPNEFVFLITDEMFTGTSPDKGEELSFNFAKRLAALQNCIFIQATHFKKLTELPALTKGICKNYYTGVVIEGGKVVKYTYKLVPGISPISTAEQIAKEEEIFDF
ncbi:hypothetical protein E3J61_04080 [Candidatus Dependentiae bacterium]|nr:MAG: hypothetical protein E3J61_04080 [Candidatus Dependentiae bacterium]